jgi:hypothetical protein
VSPTPNDNPTIFVIPCRFFIFLRGGIIIFKCCNYCHLPSDFASKFQSSRTIFIHKLLIREDRILANGWTRPSSMTILVNLIKRSVIQKRYHMTLHIIISVVLEKWVSSLNEGTQKTLMSLNYPIGKVTNRALVGPTSPPGCLFFKPLITCLYENPVVGGENEPLKGSVKSLLKLV